MHMELVEEEIPHVLERLVNGVCQLLRASLWARPLAVDAEVHTHTHKQR